MSNTTTDSILYALFCLCRDNCHVDARELGLAANVSATIAASALVTLEAQGLVDATRARLTMLGLAKAAAISGSAQGGPRIDLKSSRPRVRMAAKALPIAAQSVVPPAMERDRDREPAASELRVMHYLQGHA